MRFLRSLEHAQALGVQSELRSGSLIGVTIGNFDGMHLGHQALFSLLREQTKRAAEQAGLRPVLVLLTFAPHPRLVLSGRRKEDWNLDPEYWLLTSLSEKINLAAQAGFDFFLRIKFTPEFSRMSPEKFLNECLKETLHAHTIVVGEDWSFGSDASAGREELLGLAGHLGYQAYVVPPVRLDGERVSTRAVKYALSRGDLPRVSKLLGRNFELSGKVQHGLKRGRALGFPTANLRLRRALLPPDGVYAVLVRYDSVVYPAVTNIGFRPTFGSYTDHLVETHLLGDAPHELYGKRIRLEFVCRLRQEIKFPSAAELTTQIANDVQEAKLLLKSYRKD